MATIRVEMAADDVFYSGRWPERNRVMATSRVDMAGRIMIFSG
jgi:hypothetical protein